MSLGFKTEQIRVWTSNGLNDILIDPLDYVAKDGTHYRAPTGGTTDGLSVPRCIQNLIPATGGDWFSGVLHDSAYRGQLLRWDEPSQQWLPAALTQAQSDDLILEAMESQGVSWLMRKTIYRSLRMFGCVAFKDNRSPAGIIRNRLNPV